MYKIRVGVRLKFWFFGHYWWVLGLGAVAALAFLFWFKQPLPTIVTVVGSLVSLIYLVQKQKLEELRLFRELFKEFNERYDKINGKLASIVEFEDVEVSRQDRELLVDYFNMCGEEYFYFHRGYIDPTVWKAWHNGMISIVSSPRVQRVWLEEEQTNSYYGLKLSPKEGRDLGAAVGDPTATKLP